MTTRVEPLLDALAELLEAREEFRKAWSECSYDNAYFTHNERRRLDAAQKRFATVLDAYIAARIADRLALPPEAP